MRTHHLHARMLSFFVLLILLLGCKKTDNTSNNGSTNNNNEPPIVTAVGAPTGSSVSQNIGVAGGSLVSADGRMEIHIPAGALSASTNISIQPVTNTCPGGIGLSYNLLPNGTKIQQASNNCFPLQQG